MAHVLRITDGTTTVTFTSGNFYLADYVPQVSFFSDEPIEEELIVGFTGGVSTVRTNVNSVNRLFQQARNYTQTQTGSRVYVEFDPNTTGTVYRSLLFDSQPVVMTDDVLGDQWGAGSFEFEFSWIRQPFWEGPLTQIPLDNSSTTDSTTDSVTVNNRNDTNGDNWVDIASGDVTGDLPAPLKLELVNATTDANATDEIYVFHNVYSAPTTFEHTIEGESSSDASSTTDANSSAAAYGAFSWASTTETKIAEWALASSDLDDAAGGRFAVLARFPAVFPYTDAWLRLKLETAINYNVLWEGEQVNPAPTTDLARELGLLDTLRLPPYLEGQTSLQSIVLRLYGYRSSTDNTVNIDYLQLSPISGLYGWKRFKSVDRGVAAETTFYHDDTETPSLTYTVDSSSNKIGDYQEFGGPILLVPNQNQRLIFNTCDYLGAAEVAQSWNVKLWYRPRRSSL